ncbi:hypothetical protein ACF073_23520 [Streptomyces sp. NPDC015171]|uniref:hypothetical protein n=1 Tax=Streptomyces sp. NPDC015171 TaxID=3364945 RepID=UPI00370226B7
MSETAPSGSNVTTSSIGMRLNQLPGDAGGPYGPPVLAGGKKDLASSPAEKQAAANAIEKDIEPDTRKAGEWADSESNTAVKEFRDGWHTSGALKKAHETWGKQVKNLMNMLASDKEALRSANTVLQSTDIQTGADLRSASALSGY